MKKLDYIFSICYTTTSLNAKMPSPVQTAYFDVATALETPAIGLLVYNPEKNSAGGAQLSYADSCNSFRRDSPGIPAGRSSPV
jgi:hypothetical protein